MYGDRIQRKLFGALLPYARRNSSTSRPKQSIRHPYVHTLKLLGYDSCKFKNLDEWRKRQKNLGGESRKLSESSKRYVHIVDLTERNKVLYIIQDYKI